MTSSRYGLDQLPVIPKRIKLEGPERDEFLQQIIPVYDRGASIRAISDRTQRSYGSIQKMLKSGTVLRGRGGSSPRGSHPDSDS